MGVLERNGIESAIFGSLLHATVEGGGQAIPRIRELLGGEGIAVNRIERIEPSLEDVFVTLIETS